METEEAKMSTNILDAILLRLPPEMQIQIIQDKVTTAEGINVTTENATAGMQAVLEPFGEYPSLLAIAEQEIFRVNTFVIDAAKTLTAWDPKGNPFISSSASPLAMGVNPNVRKLVAVLDNTIQGANLDTEEPVVMWPLTKALVGALPTLYPKLESVCFRCLNLNNIRLGAVYTSGHARWPAKEEPDLCAQERAVRASYFITLVYETTFPRWRNGSGVHKTLELVQTVQEGASGLLCVPIRATRKDELAFADGGLPRYPYDGWEYMWEVFDWPVAKITFE